MTSEHKPHSELFALVWNAMGHPEGVSPDEEAAFHELEASYGRLVEQLEALEAAAQAFVATMQWHHSSILGREVPWGFTSASTDAAIALADAMGASNPASEPGWISPVQKVIELQEQLEALQTERDALYGFWESEGGPPLDSWTIDTRYPNGVSNTGTKP